MENSVSQKKTYYLRENVTGAENNECAFTFERGADAFRFYFEVRDEDVISPYEADNDDIYDGDAVEVFLSPDGDRVHYFEIEVSPYAKRFWAKVTNKTGASLDVVDRIVPPYDVKVEQTESGYRVQITVPYAVLERFDAEKYLFNAYRLDKKADGRQLLYALNPTLCGSFHRPQYFVREEKA